MEYPILEEIRKLRSDYICNYHKLPTRLLIDELSYCDCQRECSNKPGVYSGGKICGLEIFVRKHCFSRNYQKCIIVE